MADGWRLSKRQHYWERPEHWEESWRLEETCCHSDSNEKPSANADVKNSNEWIIIVIIIIMHEENCCHSDPREKLPVKTVVENSHWMNNNSMYIDR